MTFDAEKLRSIQNAAGLAGIEHFAEIGSTSTYAAQRAVSGHDRFPWLVLADRQTAGRGRGGNVWWSEAGSLTFSLLFADHRGGPRGGPAARLSLAAGLGLCDAIDAWAPNHEVRLKWPNDVYLNGRKLCGILVEAPLTATPCLVVGVGVNVNNEWTQAPAELRRTAVSLREATGEAFDLADVLTSVVLRLQESLRLLERDPETLRERWARRCYLTGRIVHLETPGGTTAGVCLGIDSDGSLLLQNEAGPSRHASGIVARIE